MIVTSPSGVTAVLLDEGRLVYEFDGETYAHFRPPFAPRARWMRLNAAQEWVEAAAPRPVRRLASEARARNVGEAARKFPLPDDVRKRRRQNVGASVFCDRVRAAGVEFEKDPRRGAVLALQAAVQLCTSVGVDDAHAEPFLALLNGLYDLDRGFVPDLLIRTRAAGERPPKYDTATRFKRVFAACAVDLRIEAGDTLEVACRYVARRLKDTSWQTVQLWRAETRKNQPVPNNRFSAKFVYGEVAGEWRGETAAEKADEAIRAARLAGRTERRYHTKGES